MAVNEYISCAVRPSNFKMWQNIFLKFMHAERLGYLVKIIKIIIITSPHFTSRFISDQVTTIQLLENSSS